jgi:hypothetical protein
LAAGVYLSEAHNPINPHHTVYLYTVYLFTQGMKEGRVEPERRGERKKAGLKILV